MNLGKMSSVRLIVLGMLVAMSGVGSAQSACVTPPSGLASWWPGDGDANDIQGSNHGSFMNGATTAPGKVGDAFSFDDGANVEVPDDPSLQFTASTPFSIDGWINVDSFNQDAEAVIAKSGTASPHFSYGVVVNPDRKLNFRLAQYGCCANDAIGTTTIQEDTWYHFAATYDGTTMKLYVNGNLESTVTRTVGGTPPPTPLYIGKEVIQPGDFTGLIDEIAIYNRALSSSEIAAIYSAGSAGKCKEVASDSDGDGLTDDVDNCPTQSGPSCNNGCPTVDTDGDGFQESTLNCPNYDQCPGEYSTTNNGCPEVPETTQPPTTTPAPATTAPPTTTLAPTTTAPPTTTPGFPGGGGGAPTTAPPTTTPAPTTTPPSITGFITITSDPPGADVLFDGVLKGSTPLTIRALPVGVSHKIAVSKPGYYKEERIVSATTRGAQVSVKLEEMPTAKNVPHLTVSQTAVKAGVGVGEETLLDCAVLNDGDADAYEVKLTMEVASGLSVSFVMGASKAGGLVYWAKDVIKEGQAESATLRVTCQDIGQKFMPMKITYKDESGNIYTDDTSLSITCSEALAGEKEIDSDGDGWSDEQEIRAGTDPNSKDTDGDGIWDPKDDNPTDPNIPKPGICGPSAVILLALLPLVGTGLLRRKD